jgi:hypothetical protein
LFFVLLGSEPERAFHFALNSELDPVKVDSFLGQAMKTGIVDPYSCVPYLHKYMHYVDQVQRLKLQKKDIPRYQNYVKMDFDLSALEANLKPLYRVEEKSVTLKLYIKALSAFVLSRYLSEAFVNTHFSSGEEESKNNLTYEILFNDKSRKSLLVGLREKKMGEDDVKDILALDQVCKKVLDTNFIDLCMFSMATLANTSERIEEQCQNILHKIVVLTIGKPQECRQILSKLIEKIFSVGKLLEILQFIMGPMNPLYREIVR